ncbi:hypothetical protein [Nonomuraea sp. SYSU D8015]|uniref:hypothetical protein n=1 Tax=Nonomuraea sp. SYSU D8015 TaxID=2593644 RepID=UPI001660E199|nr:hypothetical protein [Nonomuraea sp. SYSU D8015]
MTRYLVDLEAAAHYSAMPADGTAISSPDLGIVYMNRPLGLIATLFRGDFQDIKQAADAAYDTFVRVLEEHLQPGTFEITTVNARKAPEAPKEKI